MEKKKKETIKKHRQNMIRLRKAYNTEKKKKQKTLHRK